MSGAVLEAGYVGQGTAGEVDTRVNVSELLAHGTHVTISTASALDVWLAEDVPMSDVESDRLALARWAELLSDPDAIALLEELAEEALAEDDAGLTRDLDEIL